MVIVIMMNMFFHFSVTDQFFKKKGVGVAIISFNISKFFKVSLIVLTLIYGLYMHQILMDS